MATFQIPCECGTSLRVTASQAGTDRLCVCGRTISIPRLTEMQHKFRVEKERDNTTDERRGLSIGIMSFVALLLIFLSWCLPPLAIPVFIAMFFGGEAMVSHCDVS